MRQKILNNLRNIQRSVEQFDENRFKRNLGHARVELKYRYNKFIEKFRIK